MRLPCPFLRPFLLLTLLAATTGPVRAQDVPAGVPWLLAEERAARIGDLRYDVRLDIPDARDEAITGRETVAFTLTDTDAPVVLDFAAPDGRIHEAWVNGRPVPYRRHDEHVVLDAVYFRHGANTIELTFTAGDGSLNRRDGYLYALFVPDRARFALPVFDQPNLKGRYSLTLEVPAHWQAVANGPEVSREMVGSRALYRFGETSPLPSYLFAFAAGELMVEEAERDGRMMRMYHREQDADRLARNRDAIFDLHARALAWLEDYTGIDYPFEKFAFFLVPSFQFGGMEHPGAILYRADALLLDASATQQQELGRASLIAHETAHMWFGDLVTMRWFDDVWTKEVFANFMAAKIVNPSFPDVDHELRFLLAHYPTAYGVDRTGGTHPVRQPLDNLNEAGTLYGAIIYQKAPIVMRQLELLVGADALRDGLRAYLDRHRYGNATWPDLVALLDERADADVTAWSRRWVEDAGLPHVRVVREPGAVVLRQGEADPRLWTQQTTLALAYPDTVLYHPVRLEGHEARIALPQGRGVPRYVLPNGLGLGYATFELDPVSRRHLMAHLPDVGAPLLRAAAWLTLWEEMLAGHIAPDALFETGLAALATEPIEQNLQRILGDAGDLFWRYLPVEGRAQRADRLERLLWQRMEQAATASMRSTLFRAYRHLALTPEALARVEAVWRGDLAIEGVTFSDDDESAMALALALRAVPGWQAILDEQESRLDDGERRARFAFVRPAVDADVAVRDSVFTSFSDVGNRRNERWVLEAEGYLHHPLRADASVRYLRPALDLLQEIQRTGDIFFPKRWLDATLGGYRSPEAAAVVRAFLEEHPEYPPRLRNKILQSADELFRASAVGARPRDPAMDF